MCSVRILAWLHHISLAVSWFGQIRGFRQDVYCRCTYLQVMHPVLTFGLPIRARLTGGVDESLLVVFDGDGDLF